MEGSNWNEINILWKDLVQRASTHSSTVCDSAVYSGCQHFCYISALLHQTGKTLGLLTQGGVIWHLSHKSPFFHVGGGWQRQGHVGVKINKAWLWNLKWTAASKELILSWDVAEREWEVRKGSHKGKPQISSLVQLLAFAKVERARRRVLESGGRVVVL